MSASIQKQANPDLVQTIELMPSTRYAPFGGKRDTLDPRDHRFDPGAHARATGMPVDLRHLCGPVYDQLPLHSCSAHAIASLLEFAGNAEGQPIHAPSRLFIYYNERAREGTLPSDDGASIRSGFKSVAAQGVCAEELWPYDASKAALEPTRACYERAGMLRGLTYFRIAQDLDHLRACLAQGYAFVFGMQAYEQGFSAAQHSGHLPMPGPHDTLVGGHAVLAVGYDDASRTFTALNSLGKTFGDAGYFTLPYAFLTDPKLAYDFWTIRTLK